MYFDKFPQIDYDFHTEDGSITLRVQDIFRRVKLKRETLDDTSNFLFHVIEDGDTPDSVALKLYNDSAFWWVILLSNDIINVENQWAKSTIELNRLFDEFIKGQSLYIMENLDIHKGDVAVKRDTTEEGSLDINIWGIIDDYDPFYHKIDIKTNNSSGTFSNSDEFYIYRNTNDGYIKIDGYGATACAVQGIGQTGCAQVYGINVLDGPTAPYCPCATAGIQGTTFASAIRVESLTDSLSHFESAGNIVNPYTMMDGNSPRGISGDWYVPEGNLCGLTSTLLYKWVTDNTFPEDANTGIKSISRGADILRKNDDKRMIKVISPSILSKIVAEFYSLINKKVPPGTTKYITFQE